MTLVLASKSASRRAMLDAAGIAYRAVPAAIDERAVEAGFTSSQPKHIVTDLSVAKAMAVAQEVDEGLVLGSDSIVVVEGRRFDKPGSREEAAEHLRYFSGKLLELHAGAALVQEKQRVFDCHDSARLQVRDLSEGFIQSYLNHEWPAVAGCVGVFRIEARGIQLFDSIEGSHFTILGMPLMQILGALRKFGVIAP